MRTNNHRQFNLWMVLTAVILTLAISQQAYCRQGDPEGYSVMIQHSPIDGGRVTPLAGIQRFELNELVTLTAIPKPGYRFVYWLGDVVDQSTEQTIVIADSPKIIIAIFERTEYETLIEIDTVRAGLGRGGATPVRADLRMGPAVNSDEQKIWDWDWPEFPPFIDDDFPVASGDDFPVPESHDFPVPEDDPVPEPATIIFFGVGAASIAISKRRAKKRIN